jgi:hypothetical protein
MAMTFEELLDPAIRLMMEAVHRCEGTVNQVLGACGKNQLRERRRGPSPST